MTKFPPTPDHPEPSENYSKPLEEKAADGLMGSIGVDTEVSHGQVKWFNIEKGYGFLIPENSSKDAFLHVSVLKRHGIENIRNGTTVTFMMRPGRGGPEVAEILKIDESTANEEETNRDRRNSDDIDTLMKDAKLVEGYVKWFNPSKGYGFMVPSDGSRDIFIHMSLMRQHGIDNLIPDQKIVAFTINGPKGPEAIKISEIRHI